MRASSFALHKPPSICKSTGFGISSPFRLCLKSKCNPIFVSNNNNSISHAEKASSTSSSRDLSEFSELNVDVIVVGAGIVGLTICHEVLKTTCLSVALVDKKEPCAGATGAGQGYIWMGHRSPGTPGWHLAGRGKLLWEKLIKESSEKEIEAFGWMNTGSLLVAQSEEEAKDLKIRSLGLSSSGVESIYLTPSEAMDLEPCLKVSDKGGAILVPKDSQIDAKLAVQKLLEACQEYASGPNPCRYYQLFNQPVESLIRSPTNEIKGVLTDMSRIKASTAVVIAAGAWSAHLMSSFALDSPCVPPVKPRKGHLLVLEPGSFPDLQLNRALMEAEYTANYSNSPASSASVQPSVSMTVTRDSSGNFLIGSSREWRGFNTCADLRVILSMIKRVSQFVPELAIVGATLAAMDDSGMVIRSGLRPYSMDGRPIIGPAPGFSHLYFACGHEGSGLCMALSTAELVVDMILGKEPLLDPRPFLPTGRLLSQAPS